MIEDVGSLLEYREILAVRQHLSQAVRLSYEETERFAGSILAEKDIALLKNLIRPGSDPTVAGDASFLLFTRGGVGNQNSLIREWFEAGDTASHMTESAPLVLAGCVRQLDDGTALRQLFEFSHVRDVKVILDQVLDDVDVLDFEALFRQSATEQIDSLIRRRGPTPSNRFLWTLRTYGRFENVKAYLHARIAEGSIAALASYSIHAGILDWSLFQRPQPLDDFELRLANNVALENVARGADLHDAQAQAFVERLSGTAREEFEHGLSALRRLAQRRPA